MKLLLDTHVFLWIISGDPRIPAAFRAVIQDLDNDVYLSVASVWEAIIKYLTYPKAEGLSVVRARQWANTIECLSTMDKTRCTKPRHRAMGIVSRRRTGERAES